MTFAKTSKTVWSSSPSWRSWVAKGFPDTTRIQTWESTRSTTSSLHSDSSTREEWNCNLLQLKVRCGCSCSCPSLSVFPFPFRSFTNDLSFCSLLTDVVDGNLKLIMGTLWTMFRQIGKLCRPYHEQHDFAPLSEEWIVNQVRSSCLNWVRIFLRERKIQVLQKQSSEQSAAARLCELQLKCNKSESAAVDLV